MNHKNTLRSGFSLIELLIVIVILGGLMAVVAPGLMDSQKKATRNTMCLKMNDLKKRFDMFSLDNGMYPDTEEGFQALMSNPDADKYPGYPVKPYLKKIPKDAWKKPFVYIKKGSDLEIISYAADRRDGGEEWDKDILLSDCNK
ncbi:MAG: type II secretion system major pseudopilin GspG [Campylobacterota bacterium]|nr:type II secretion system major pseudopilin GspG [Campylobacterota bacterium]